VAKRSLDPYATKRAFNRTPEPAPRRPARRIGPLLFVVQKHAARRLHYDFRLELDGVLKSWAVPKGPSLVVGEKRLAVEVEDHPFEYASFEGLIPERQYGAGKVIVWDCGVYSPDEDHVYAWGDRSSAEERVRAGLALGKLSIFLRGGKLKGSFALVRTANARQWLLLKHKDRFATPEGMPLDNRSVLSGGTLEDPDIREATAQSDAAQLTPNGPLEALPVDLAPMLASQGETPHTSAEWTYEPKVDGYRTIACVSDGEVRLRSRRGLDLTAAFPEVVADLAEQAVDAMVLDGELVALGSDGRPSFNALQNRAGLKPGSALDRARRETPAVLLCFDLLHFAGVNLRDSPYVERRRWLTQCLLPSTHVQLISTSDQAEPLYAASLENGFEGIVAKRRDSRYQPGRRAKSWMKFKATRTGEFVVGGYTQGKASRAPLGALLLGYWSGRKLIYAGHVGSGLNERMLKSLRAQLADLERGTSPFAEPPDLHRPTTWIDPELVVEVSFAQWTLDGRLRAPVFLRVRDDRDPRSIRRDTGARSRARARPSPTPATGVADVLRQLEARADRLILTVDGHTIRLSNLERVYWPGDRRAGYTDVTKRDLLRYLAAVSPYMLPHLEDRPLTLIRMPAGIAGERFFQKHWEQARPDFVESVKVYSGHKNELHEYLLANNLPTLLWLGQNGALEFHVWHSRAHVDPDALSQGTDYGTSRATLEASVLNYPDYLVFDLDPYIYSGKEPKGAEPELNKKGFATGRKVAFWLRSLLQEMSLDAVVKTSGKTGLHVFVPIERTVTFAEARQLCELIGRHLMRAHPKDITMDWSVGKRTGRIFIDYNMNVRGKTLNVAYSPRGVPGAPVSMPVTWDELEIAEPGQFTVVSALARLAKTGDRWHDVLLRKQSLAHAFAGDTRTRGRARR
jgi:bifunctional non-homologous end joining protein LigD